MAISAQKTPEAAAPKLAPGMPVMDAATAQKYAERTIAFMQEHQILPLPENYTIFFHYVLSLNPGLVKEVDQAIVQRMPFSSHMLRNLYHKYVIANANEQVLNDVTQGASKMLGEVVRIVGEFSRETNAYNEDIDGYLHKMEIQIDDPNLQGMVKQLISSTAAMKERGESLNSKLDASRSEVDALKHNLERLREESQQDFLTGVLNRKALEQVLEEQLAYHADGKHDLTLLMIDVDHFKNFNDKYGHLLGDEVLKIVARALTYSVRGKDQVGRYGGEEFCVMLPETPLTGALKVAETIRNTIANRDLKRKDTGESYGQVTVSIGVSQFRPRTDTLETLIRRADDALYKSKHNGRNRVTQEE